MVERLVPAAVVNSWNMDNHVPSNVVKVSVPTTIIDGKEVATSNGYFLVTFRV